MFRNLMNRTARRSFRSFASSSSGAEPNKRRYKLALSFFVFTGLVTASLGVWQSKRYFFKVDLIERLKEDLELDPVAFKKGEGERSDRRRVLISGKFDFSKEFLIGPRSCPLGLFGPAAKGMATNPQGYYVYTPLITTEGEIVIINRGWIPRNSNYWSRPEGTVSITAVLSPSEVGGSFAPKQSLKGINSISSTFGPVKTLIWPEEAVISEIIGMPKVFSFDSVLMDPEETKAALGPYSKPTELFLKQTIEPETHLGYAATWYCLSLFSLGVSSKFIKKIK